MSCKVMLRLKSKFVYIWINSFLEISLVFMRVKLVEFKSLKKNKKTVEPIEAISQEVFWIFIQDF